MAFGLCGQQRYGRAYGGEIAIKDYILCLVQGDWPERAIAVGQLSGKQHGWVSPFFVALPQVDTAGEIRK